MSAFEEKQYMINPPLARYGLGILMLALIVLMIVIYLEQWGTNPLPLYGLIFVSLLFVILFVVFMFLMMKITVDDSEIRIKTIPTRRILLSEIEKCEIREYKPLKEYGGWGVRYTFGKKIGYISSRVGKGVELTLKDGKRVMIGTDRYEDLFNAINN